MQSQRKDHGDQMCAAPITLCAGKWVLGATWQCLTLHEGNLVIPGLPSCSCLCVKSLLSARRRQKGREPTWTAIMQAGGRQLAIVSIAWSLYCTSHLTPRHHQEQLWPQSWFQLSLRQHGARAGGKGGRGPGWQILILFAFQWQIMFYHFVPAFSFYKKAFPPLLCSSVEGQWSDCSVILPSWWVFLLHVRRSPLIRCPRHWLRSSVSGHLIRPHICHFFSTDIICDIQIKYELCTWSAFFAVKPLIEAVFSQSPTGPFYPSTFYYQGFEDDIYLLIKLSHVALIVFIIFAIVTMIYLVVSCCVSFTRRREKEVSG